MVGRDGDFSALSVDSRCLRQRHKPMRIRALPHQLRALSEQPEIRLSGLHASHQNVVDFLAANVQLIQIH